jgi:hypothetical protein
VRGLVLQLDQASKTTVHLSCRVKIKASFVAVLPLTPTLSPEYRGEGANTKTSSLRHACKHFRPRCIPIQPQFVRQRPNPNAQRLCGAGAMAVVVIERGFD